MATQEQRAGDEVGDAGPRALADAGRATRCTRCCWRRWPRRRPPPRASRRAGSPGSAAAAVLVEQAALLADRDHVPIVSKKSVSSRVKTNSSATSHAGRLQGAEQAELARAGRSRGRRRRSAGTAGTFRLQPSGLRCPAGRTRPTWRSPRRRSRGRCGDDADEDGALHLARPAGSAVSSRPKHEHQHRPAAQRAVDAEPDRTVVPAASGMRRTKPASTKSDEGDEQADADADRGLQLRRARRGRPPCATRSAPAA